MENRLAAGFVAGFIGALILIAIMLAMQFAGGGPPMFAGAYQQTLGPASLLTAEVVGGALFAVAGGLWGLLFTALVTDPGVLKGMLFGIAPALFLWLFVAPVILGQPLFMGFQPRGLILPFVFNVLIWGSFVGWYTGQQVAARRGVASTAHG